MSGAQHPRVGLILFILADVYARSKRITMAEGLFRWAHDCISVITSWSR